MNFPLTFRFKLFALAPQIFVADAAGTQIFYIKQKLFKLRDAINVFSDQNQTQQVAAINADRMIDFSAKFNITNNEGQLLGSIGRKGFKSMFRAHYDLSDHTGQIVGSIKEESVFARIMDSLIAEIPVVGVLSIYIFQPKYLLTDNAGTPIMRLKKVPSWVDRRFEMEKLGNVSDYEEYRNVLAFLMMVLLERHRK